MSSKAEHQVAAVERLLDRQRSMSSFGYDDGFITVSLAEVAGALAEGVTAWENAEVCPECQQGKHDNCTDEVLIDDETYVDCVCKVQGHGE